jgi:hypothetical protein
MAKLLALIAVIFVLVGCGGPGVTGPCPDPDPDPNSPCASSHGQTHDSHR